MKPHPFTEYWPLLDGENFSKFKADIAANGLKLPILTYQDQILDGRNRERACEETGMLARYEDCGAKSDEEALALVVSLNEHRRHLSEDERVFAASRLAKLEHGSNQYQPKIMDPSKERSTSKTVITLEKAAKLMNVSYGSATRARSILQHGTKEDEQDVVSGKVSLAKKDEQVRNRNNGVHRLSISRNAKKRETKDNRTIAVPYRDLDKFRLLIKRVKEQSDRHAATVSFMALRIIAHELKQLADSWMKNGTEPGTHSAPVSLNSVQKGR